MTADYKKRVFEEWALLKQRSEKLSMFVKAEKFSALDKEDCDLLVTQLAIMLKYEDVLMARINRF